LKLTPSMKTLTLSAGRAPAAKLPFWSTRTPGACCASARKLRLFWGRFSICSVEILVATSGVRVSATGLDIGRLGLDRQRLDAAEAVDLVGAREVLRARNVGRLGQPSPWGRR